jgi:hypothetical protein
MKISLAWWRRWILVSDAKTWKLLFLAQLLVCSKLMSEPWFLYAALVWWTKFKMKLSKNTYADLELGSASLFGWSLEPFCSENACLCLPTRFHSPAPFPPPPHPVLVYDLSGKIRTGCPVWACVLAKLLAWLFRAKTCPLSLPTFRTPFRLTKFSAFSENSSFESPTRFRLIRFSVP